jgi:hypothetical protein
MAQLGTARYERDQREGESFPMYVQSIKDAALVLRIEESEAQVVERVVEGLTLVQLAHFVFQAPPSSFKQLESLVILDRNTVYADHARKGTRSEVMRAALDPRNHDQQIKTSRRNTIHMPSSRKTVICFYCQKRGHVQSRCSLWLRNESKLESAERNSRP